MLDKLIKSSNNILNLGSNLFVKTVINQGGYQKFNIGMRYKAKLSTGGKILLSCEGFNYKDTLYLYTDKIDTNAQWVTQYLDTQWTEFIEGKGIFSIGFRDSTTGTFIIDEIFFFQRFQENKKSI